MACLSIRNHTKAGLLYSKLVHNEHAGRILNFDKERLVFLLPILISMGSHEHFQNNLDALIQMATSANSSSSSSTSSSSSSSTAMGSPGILSRQNSSSSGIIGGGGSSSNDPQSAKGIEMNGMLRPHLIPGVAKIAALSPTLFDFERHVSPFEKFICNSLLKADEADKTQKKIFRASSILSIPVTELDGSNVSDFFSVLNSAVQFTSSQICNLISFSCLKSWIHSIYVVPAMEAAVLRQRLLKSRATADPQRQL